MELIGGRPVVNSVNFEDGDGENSRFGTIMPLVKEHGAAVIALTIDEEGQARTTKDKVRIASRLVTPWWISGDFAWMTSSWMR